jgi:hypothetical protein
MHHKTMEYFAFTWKIYCLVHMITKTRQWCRATKTGKTVWLKSSYLIYNEKHCIHWDEWLFNILFVYINFHNFRYIVVILFVNLGLVCIMVVFPCECKIFHCFVMHDNDLVHKSLPRAIDLKSVLIYFISRIIFV